jgi:murein DD-endopeptidase MepM/ murein hydrolase activator NlpD
MKKHWSTKTWLTWHKVRRLFGVQFASLALAISTVTYPTHTFDYEVIAATPVVPLEQAVVVTTNNTFALPLELTHGMSQGFHGLHPGLDLRAPRGTAVLAASSGVVVQVEKIWGGYGHYVRIAHAGTLSSLYAHLDEVLVESGDKVAIGEKIGTVGMTGRTTGPHLHFELYLGQRAVNPLSYFPVK